MNCPSYGHWNSLFQLAQFHKLPLRKALGLVANGHAKIGKPKLYAHQSAQLDQHGRWIIGMQDQKSCAQITPRPSPVSSETAKAYYKDMPVLGVVGWNAARVGVRSNCG